MLTTPYTGVTQSYQSEYLWVATKPTLAVFWRRFLERLPGMGSPELAQLKYHTVTVRSGLGTPLPDFVLVAKSSVTKGEYTMRTTHARDTSWASVRAKRKTKGNSASCLTRTPCAHSLPLSGRTARLGSIVEERDATCGALRDNVAERATLAHGRWHLSEATFELGATSLEREKPRPGARIGIKDAGATDARWHSWCGCCEK